MAKKRTDKERLDWLSEPKNWREMNRLIQYTETDMQTLRLGLDAAMNAESQENKHG